MCPKLKRAQIILYAILGLFDKAVKLSLECKDLEMAKNYANKPNDKKLKKKLWMKIAKYLFNY
jgi:vacuolar protein sorting-associated protein 18